MWELFEIGCKRNVRQVNLYGTLCTTKYLYGFYVFKFFEK